MNQREAALRRLRQKKVSKDPRGPVGIFSRGKNIYNGVSTAAHKGGGIQYGRPSNDPIRRRMQGRR